MSKKTIRNRENLERAMELEKEASFADALKLYQKVAKADALNEQAWNRAMVILRKLKKGDEEVKLIEMAITNFRKAAEESQKNWAAMNKKKVDATKDLAKALGLLTSNGLPEISSEAVERWQTRLHLLSHRLANAKLKEKRKSKDKAKPSQKSTVKKKAATKS